MTSVIELAQSNPLGWGPTMENGIAKLRSTEPRGYAFLLADDATFAKWSGVSRAELWKMVLLHSHLDPDLNDWFVLKHYLASHAHLLTFADESPLEFDPVELIRKNLKAAAAAVQGGELRPVKRPSGSDPETALVSMGDFLLWSLRSHLPVVPGFEGRNRLPWGTYTTPKLEALFAVAELWRDYQQERPETAPPTKASRKILNRHGMSGTAAEAINSILRHPSLQPGPRARRAHTPS